MVNPFMVGKVAVQVFLVNGPTPDLRFTANEDLLIRAMANGGLALLGSHARANVPRVPLQFSLQISVVEVATPNAFAPLPDIGSDFEAREAPWRDAALAVLGQPPADAGCLALAAAGQGGAEHSLVCWVTKYNLAWQAYAYPQAASVKIDWPWLLDVGRKGNGLAAADKVLAHEIGHIFQAPDEYIRPSATPGAAPLGCRVLTLDGKGYGAFDWPNFNCERTNPSPASCLMHGGASEASFLCESTRIHWGWVDANQNGILDVRE